MPPAGCSGSGRRPDSGRRHRNNRIEPVPVRSGEHPAHRPRLRRFPKRHRLVSVRSLTEWEKSGLMATRRRENLTTILSQVRHRRWCAPHRRLFISRRGCCRPRQAGFPSSPGFVRRVMRPVAYCDMWRARIVHRVAPRRPNAICFRCPFQIGFRRGAGPLFKPRQRVVELMAWTLATDSGAADVRQVSLSGCFVRLMIFLFHVCRLIDARQSPSTSKLAACDRCATSHATGSDPASFR